jgi:PLP dependent protein
MADKPEEIRMNYEHVLDEIELARRRGKNSASEVNLVVVTKSQTVETIQAAYVAGARIFGENYPEQAEPKIMAMEGFQEIQWHMIGHLQSRKAPIIVQHFDMLQSLDNLELAQKLNGRLSLVNRKLPILLEVNIAGELSKSGFDAQVPERWQGLVSQFTEISKLSNLEVKGLMTMPPIYEDGELSRIHFKQLRELQKFLRIKIPSACWDELSMGTSFDYQVAVEEGATYVRVGTAIVGARSG